jgi:hypothetical protein
MRSATLPVDDVVDHSAGDGHWTAWSIADWNAALFRFFFVPDDGALRPVRRLTATYNTWLRIVDDPDAKPQEVEAAFLTCLQRTPEEFTNEVSAVHLTRGEWKSRRLPKFFVWLFFTCVVASGDHEDLVGEGDFRRRLQKTLNHPPNTSYNNLSDLPLLWRAFDAWLRERQSEGFPVRLIVLPDPRRETLIGYSKQLAFPAHRDLRRLVRLLSDKRLGEPPPVHMVLSIVGSSISSFRNDFQDAYWAFRKEWTHGRFFDTEDDLFWTCIQDAVRIPAANRSGDASLRYHLLLERGAVGRELTLRANKKPDSEVRGYAFVKDNFGTRDFPFAVSSDQGELAGLLLADPRGVGLPGLHSSAIAAAVRQGVLLFCEGELGLHELSLTLPRPDDNVRALVRDGLSGPFKRLFPLRDCPKHPKAVYPGWTEFAPFEGRWLDKLYRELPVELRDVRCLMRAPESISIRFSGAVALNDGYLGLSACLPRVRIEDADTIDAMIENLSGSARSVSLTHTGPGEFQFPENAGDMNGRCRIVASRRGDCLAIRTTAFYDTVLGCAYAWPSEPDMWCVEHGVSDTLPLSMRDQTLDQPDPATVLHYRKAPPQLTEGPEVHSVDLNPQQYRRIESFVEWSAALANTRRGIAESDFLSMLEIAFGISDRRLLWLVARCWLENGHFERATSMRWRRNIYLALTPRLVVWHDGNHWVGRLTGLAPTVVRNRVSTVASSMGLAERPRKTLSPFVPPGLSWAAPQRELLDELACTTEILPVTEWTPISQLATSVTTIGSPREEERPGGRVLYGYWDWEQGHFGARADRGVSVSIGLWRRDDRRDLFEVMLAGKSVWWTYERNWALLVACGLAGQNAFHISGPAGLVQHEALAVHLPLTLARAISVRSEASWGPTQLNNGAWVYAMDCESPSLRSQMLALLWPQKRGEEIDHRIADWLRIRLRRAEAVGEKRRVFLPENLRRRLQSAGGSNFADLVFIAYPPYLISYVHMMMSEVQADIGRRSR